MSGGSSFSGADRGTTEADRKASEATLGGGGAARDAISPFQAAENRRAVEAESARLALEAQNTPAERQKRRTAETRPRGRAATIFSRNTEDEETSLARRTLLGF